MAQRGRPQAAHELRHDLALARFLEGGVRHHEIAGLRQALRADRAELRQAERRAIVLTYVAARLLLEKFHFELHAARDHTDLARRELQPAELGENNEAALLRNEHQLAVGAIKVAPFHRAIGTIDVHRDAALHCRTARPGE